MRTLRNFFREVSTTAASLWLAAVFLSIRQDYYDAKWALS